MAELSAYTRLAQGTLRRYADYRSDEILNGRAGPQKIPGLLRILDGLSVSPARLAVALQYGADEHGFMRIMNGRLCSEQRVRFQIGPGGPPRLDCRLIRLEDPPPPGPWPKLEPRIGRVAFPYGKLQHRLAWFLNHQLRGRYEEMHAVCGVTTPTMRRYSDMTRAEEGLGGPHKLRSFCALVRGLNVDFAKLIVAAQYGADEASFWALLHSEMCVEETLQFHQPGEEPKLVRKLYRFDQPAAA